MKTAVSFLAPLFLTAFAMAQTTVVDETFTYADGLLDAVGTGGSGWDAAEGGWQTGNSIAAQNRFEVISNEAIYLGGGVGTNTEQNRTFASALTSNATDSIAVNFTLLYNEVFSGRGIGIYLTNGGANQYFIGKRVNGSVGLHSSMGAGSTYASFSNTGSAETITATITYNGTDTSIILSDSDEVLDTYTVAGPLTFDGISLAGYNGATTTNGVDDISVTTTTNPDAWLQVDALAEFSGNGVATAYSIPVFNQGATQTLTISGVLATGLDAGDVSGLSFPSTLAPLTAGSIDFTFTPTQGALEHQFTFEITSSDASEASPRYVDVYVDIIEPLIEIDVTSIDFGTFANNPGPQTANLMVTNNGGSESLTINSTDITGSSAFTVTSAPTSIAPGATAAIEITFDPSTQPGDFSGTLTIVSNDYYFTEPTVTLSASTAFGGTMLANYPFGTTTTLDLTSTDTAIGSNAGTLLETDLGAKTEFGSKVVNGTANASIPALIDGNSIGWSRREAPNTGLDLTTTAPTEALAFTLTPAPGYTVDFTTDGWLTLDLGAYSEIGGPTAYDFALTVDDGTNPPFTLGPVMGASIPGVGEDQQMVTFDVRSLGAVTAAVNFSLMPQTTANSNGTLGQCGGYIDNITLSGEEIAPLTPQLVVTSPAILTDEGLGGPFSLPIQNLGAAELTITSVTTDGSGNASTISNITFDTPLTALGGTGNINFDFTPDAGPGLYTSNLTVTSNDPGSPGTIALEITVRDPEILVANPTVSFGPLPNNPGVQTLNLTVTNDGEAADLVISGTTLTGASEFTITSLPAAIAPGATGEIEVTFTPGAAVGRLNASMSIQSNDYDGTEPTVALTGFVEPAGIIVSRFDFDPDQNAGTIVDLDGSSMANWTTGDLIDMATGTGAAGDNQNTNNRVAVAGVSGNYLRFSCNREGDAQTPLLPGGNNESTWTRFTLTPDAGGGAIDFTGGSAVIDTYANTSLNNNTAADWTLYYLLDGAPTWVSLGTSAGASISSGTSAPLSLTWDLTSIANQTTPVQFILDPVSTGGTNGTSGQRGIGFDNLILTAGSITPGTGTGGFSSWASGFGIPNDPSYDATDNDGNVALVEYALGLSPLVSEGAPGTLTGGQLSFNKSTTAVTNGDVTYAIETSPNLLAPWTPVSYILPDVNDGSTISYTLPTGLGKIFARLVVTQIP